MLDRTIGIRVTPEQERQGLDTALHAESAYENPEALAHQPRGHAEQEHHLDLGIDVEAEPVGRG